MVRYLCSIWHFGAVVRTGYRLVLKTWLLR